MIQQSILGYFIREYTLTKKSPISIPDSWILLGRTGLQYLTTEYFLTALNELKI